MKVLLVSEAFAPSSSPAAETARHVTDGLLVAGHQVLVLTAGPGSSSYRGARVVRTRAVIPVASARRRAEEYGPDLVLVLRPRTLGAAVMRALEPSGVPMVVLDPTPLHPRVGTVLASSESAVRVLAAAGVRAQVWRPGIRADEHHPGLRSTDLHDRWAKAGTPQGPLTVVGYVGPVGQPTTKTVRRLTRIAALPGVRLVVIGSGPGVASLKAAGAKIVGETGGLELARAIASCDVVVQPRRKDTGLAVVLKALASGVPVVAFRTGAAAEVVAAGRTGLLVDRTPGLIGAVARLAEDPDLRSELAAAARTSVAGRTWTDAVAELVAVPSPLPAAV